MRLRHIKNSETDIYNSPYVLMNYCSYKGIWNTIFNNDNPIEIEIGTGKGNFLISKALNNKNINYIGIEKYPSVLLKACTKLDTLNLDNIKLIVLDAFYINDVFYKEVDKIYLNFSDPWPKKKHIKRRLTSKDFLIKYDSIFKKKCILEMKTDNINLFEFSKESFIDYGYSIETISYDEDSIYKTEYEKKFFDKGNKINYIKVIKEAKE
ncbi:MAG: tRNA (guanosine(46)-N7)-methyltransferase TrmB [Bacilli bacterium]